MNLSQGERVTKFVTYTSARTIKAAYTSAIVSCRIVDALINGKKICSFCARLKIRFNAVLSFSVSTFSQLHSSVVLYYFRTFSL